MKWTSGSCRIAKLSGNLESAPKENYLIKAFSIYYIVTAESKIFSACSILFYLSLALAGLSYRMSSSWPIKSQNNLAHASLPALFVGCLGCSFSFSLAFRSRPCSTSIVALLCFAKSNPYSVSARPCGSWYVFKDQRIVIKNKSNGVLI